MSDSALVMGLAGLTFMMTVIWGGPLLRILRHFKIGKIIRVEEPGDALGQNGHTHHGRRHDHPAGGT